MSRAEVSSSERSSRLAAAPAVDGDLAFLRRFAGPLVLLARAMLVYIFLMDGWYQGHALRRGERLYEPERRRAGPPVARHPDPLGGGILVLIGVKARWAAIALMGFCLLAALFFHMGADQANNFGKNIAIAGGFLALATFGPGPWSIDAWRGRAG